MDFLFSPLFWAAFLQVIWIDLLLSGDNAVVIAMASRKLPPKQQRQALIFGPLAAVTLRVVLTIFALELMQFDYLKLVGGILLIWIGVKLIGGDEDNPEELNASSGLFEAIKTIVIADFVMSLDNVLAVAGAAQSAGVEHERLLIMLGLAISIPIVVFGSSMVIKLMARFPIIITLGGMLLGWLGGSMIAKEAMIFNAIKAQGIPETVSHFVSAGLGALAVLSIKMIRQKGSSQHANS